MRAAPALALALRRRRRRRCAGAGVGASAAPAPTPVPAPAPLLALAPEDLKGLGSVDFIHLDRSRPRYWEAGIDDILENVADLQTAFHEAVDDYIATCEKIGKIPQKPYSGRMMFRVSPEVHRKAALAAELSGKSLNQWAEEALARAASDQYPAAS